MFGKCELADAFGLTDRENIAPNNNKKKKHTVSTVESSARVTGALAGEGGPESWRWINDDATRAFITPLLENGSDSSVEMDGSKPPPPVLTVGSNGGKLVCLLVQIPGDLMPVQ